MKYNFTDRTRKVLARAREQAVRLGHDYVGTEHILLGLVDEGGVSAQVLDDRGVTPEDVRDLIERSVRPGKTPGRGAAELPYTSRSKKTLELSMSEARSMRHDYVGTEHLLLGLIREEKGIAAQTLRALGIELGETRRAVLHLLTSPDAADRAPRRADGPGSRFRVRIDDTSSSSIYEQIVAQVREAVATGALGPGERLPSVRRMADDLDIAPGTVARAYGELEQLGVVVTEGARGTRVAEPQGDAPPAPERRETLIGLLRPVAVAAFHMGATAQDLRDALGPAMEGILGERGVAGRGGKR